MKSIWKMKRRILKLKLSQFLSNHEFKIQFNGIKIYYHFKNLPFSKHSLFPPYREQSFAHLNAFSLLGDKELQGIYPLGHRTRTLSWLAHPPHISPKLPFAHSILLVFVGGVVAKHVIPDCHSTLYRYFWSGRHGFNNSQPA